MKATNEGACPTHGEDLDPRCGLCLDIARENSTSELRDEHLGDPVPVHPGQIGIFEGGAR